jgi:hypothetical protein
MATTHVGGGGFVPALKRTTLTSPGGPNFLASEKKTNKRSGITLSAAVVTADGNGDKILAAGTFVTPITSAGPEVTKYGPFDSAASDGRQTPDKDVSGYLPEAVNLRDGDVICGLVIQGTVLKARVTPANPGSTVRNAVAGRILFQ